MSIPSTAMTSEFVLIIVTYPHGNEPEIYLAWKSLLTEKELIALTKNVGKYPPFGTETDYDEVDINKLVVLNKMHPMGLVNVVATYWFAVV